MAQFTREPEFSRMSEGAISISQAERHPVSGKWRDWWLMTDLRGGADPIIGAEVETPDEWFAAISVGAGVAITPRSTAGRRRGTYGRDSAQGLESRRSTSLHRRVPMGHRGRMGLGE